jgi:hypothetical protein
MQADGYRRGETGVGRPAWGDRRGEVFSVGPIPSFANTIGARISRVFYRHAKRLWAVGVRAPALAVAPPHNLG